MTIAIASFGIIDYCLFITMLVCLLGTGGLATSRGTKSAEEFLHGNRSFSTIFAGLSLLAYFISSISILGFSGETYAYGMQVVWYLAGIVLALAVSRTFIVPVIYPLKLTSINEYLKLRFNSLSLCRAVTILTSINDSLYTGAVLYAPTIVLSAVIPFSLGSHILILGVVVTLYSSTGGVRAIIWTQVLQLTITTLGLMVIVGLGLYEVGPTQVWNTAMSGRRLEIFDTSLNPYKRHTLWNTIIFGFFLGLSNLGFSQTITQRIGGVANQKQVDRMLWINCFGMVFIYSLIFIGGLVSYVAYAGCDPWMQGILDKKEQIMLYFISDRLKFIPGLPGIFIATVTAGTFSAYSSTLNGVVAMLWKDCLSHLEILKNIKPLMTAIITKLLSFVVGGIIIFIAILSSNATNLVEFSLTLVSATLGPIMGIFSLGLLFPRTNSKGAWLGLFSSLVLSSWITFGSFLYTNIDPPLPLSTKECLSISLNVSEIDIGEALYEATQHNSTVDNQGIQDDSTELQLMKLYRISYTLHGILGSIICIVVGIIVSFFTGNEDLKTLPPKYISPFVRRLYWEPEFLQMAETEDRKKQDLEATMKWESQHATSDMTILKPEYF